MAHVDMILPARDRGPGWWLAFPGVPTTTNGRDASSGPAPGDRAAAGAGGQPGELPGDVDDALHAQHGVVTAVLGVHEAGQHPVARPVADDLLLVGAVGQQVEEHVL